MSTGDFGYAFKQAKFYTPGRGGYNPIWIVRHCTDDDESPTYAEGLGNYLSSPSLTRKVSAHFGVDSNSVMQYVRLADTAYGAGSPANARGVHIEHSGLESQTHAQWLDAFGQGMMEQSAQLHAKIHRATGIPFRPRYLTAQELLTRVPGTTRHMDLVRVFGGTHDRCPGVAFPNAVLDARIGQILSGGGKPVEPTDSQSVRIHDPDNDRVVNTLIESGSGVTNWTEALRHFYRCPHEEGSRMELDHAWRLRAFNDAKYGTGRWEHLTPGATVIDVPRLLGF